jgi:hypothetical protein
MTSMNLTRLLALLLGVLVFASAISVVNADITKDYGETTSKDAYGNKRFSFRVRMTVETEENNEWLPNKNYDITINIELTFVNKSVFPYDYSLSLRFFGLSGINVSYGTIDIYDISVYLGESGSLHTQASSVANPLEKPCIKPHMNYQIEPNPDTVYQWSTDEITYIEVSTPPSSVSPEFLIVASGIIIGAVAVASYIAVKTRKKKS